MQVQTERMRILRQVQLGKLTHAEATRTLQALEAKPQKRDNGYSLSPELLSAKGLMNPRMLRIRKTDLETGKTIYDFMFRASLLDASRRLGAKLSTQLNAIDEKGWRKLLSTHKPGILFDELHAGGKLRIEVFLF